MGSQPDGEQTSLRFYPDSLPRFDHEPTRDRFHIGFEDDSIGEGVRSLVSFSPGDLVASFTGFLTTEVTQFTLQIRKDLHLHDPYFYGKILHSCAPNTQINVARRKFLALKPIAPGDFVTIDYAHTEDYLFRNFPCACGAPNCRKTVLGRRQIITPELEAQVARIEGRRGEVLPLTARVSPPMDLFEILTDSTRRKILSLLREKHLRSVDLAATMRVGYSAVSYHLRILRQAGLVTQYRQGRLLLYALDDQRLQTMLEESRSHVEDWSNQLLIPPVQRRTFAPREHYHRGE